jgi:uncharacterized membrane protein YoaK (UPF0700 family)
MERKDVLDLGLAVILVAVAAWVDAVGYLSLGHRFVSFVSGNSTKLAIATSSGGWHDASVLAGIVGSFVAGVMIGYSLSKRTGAWHRPVILALEATLLGLSTGFVGSSDTLAVSLALAMGIQNTTVHEGRWAKARLTYVTGTLVHFAEGVIDALLSPERNRRWAWAPYLLLYFGFAVGAVSGAVAYRGWGRHALFVPTAMTAILALVTVATTADIERRAASPRR